MSDRDDATVDVSTEDRTDVRLPPPADPIGDARRDFAERLVEEARATGVNLVGPGGLLSDVTKRALETGMQVEITDQLGYEKHAAEGRDGGKSRNGTRSKTALTDVGPVGLDVPRDRHGTFESQPVRKRQRRLEGVDAMVISPCAKGLTTSQIAAHFAEVHGAVMSKDQTSKITDAVPRT